MTHKPEPKMNELLAALPQVIWDRWFPQLERVDMA
jgi:hypothetical protein